MASSVAANPNTPQVAAYFEGTNILVYIRGTSDDPGAWWKGADVHNTRRNEKGLTLVNAHYDSLVPSSSAVNIQDFYTFGWLTAVLGFRPGMAPRTMG